MKFVDEATIQVKAGKGGNGCVSFRREKFVAKGGPDGGNGGDGGNVYARASNRLYSLYDFRLKRMYEAPNGQGGMGSQCDGHKGEDLIIELPSGTQLYERTGEGEQLFADISDPDKLVLLAAGGRGGKGNEHFKSSTMRAPRFAQKGEPGEERSFRLELKILADAGLLGLPNAGKSTFLSRVSAARPKIADYPFTTLTPNLGIVPYYDMKSFIMADIPGIIEGASEGKGLGLRFLRHIERNSILLFLVAADSPDVKEAYDILLGELKKYNPELLDKKRILAISKCDLIDEQQRKDIKKHLPKKIPHIFISSAAGEGIKELKDLIWLSLTAEEE